MQLHSLKTLKYARGAEIKLLQQKEEELKINEHNNSKQRWTFLRAKQR